MSRTGVASEVPPDVPVGTAATSSTVSGGNRTAIRAVLVVISVVVALGSLVSLGVLAVGVSSIRVVNDTQALPANMRSLAIDTGGVPVVVRPVTDADAREPRIDLRMVTRGDDTRLAVADSAAGSRVTLSDNGSGFLWFNPSGEIKLVLPPGVAQKLSVTVNDQARSLT
ncbi:hypothetical protein [Mycobacterium sp. 2YAF39]|uniref:hypothetical protein n=1 Tax=Mycobacterium sp. 2YAF39 TaxID=3233033 RepID=UPI003F9E146E